MLESISLFAKLLVTLAVGCACGLGFKRLHVPAGYMVGAFVGVATLGCAFSGAWVPDGTRTAVQIVAGAFVGCSMERSDLRRLAKIAGPVAVMLVACLAVMFVGGGLIWATGTLELRTSLMCAVPGGINDTPVVAADMGADAPSVAVLQLVRQILGIAILPAIISGFDKLRVSRGSTGSREQDAVANVDQRIKSEQKSPAATCAVLSAATVCGLLGKLTGVAGMTFTFAIAAALILKLVFDFAFIPKWVKKACQLVAGCYLGTLLTPESLAGMGSLVVPILIVTAVYTLNCFATGRIERKFFGYGRKESMLIASPAGASDMALIMEDMEIRNTNVVIMQVVRAVVVMSCFPQIVNLVCMVIGG